MTDTREPVRTRAEQLHDRRFTNGAWQTESLNPMFREPPSRETLLARIATLEDEMPERLAIADRTRKKYDSAERGHRIATGALRRAQDDLDIYKIMLAEQMEIPR